LGQTAKCGNAPGIGLEVGDEPAGEQHLLTAKMPQCREPVDLSQVDAQKGQPLSFPSASIVGDQQAIRLVDEIAGEKQPWESLDEKVVEGVRASAPEEEGGSGEAFRRREARRGEHRVMGEAMFPFLQSFGDDKATLRIVNCAGVCVYACVRQGVDETIWFACDVALVLGYERPGGMITVVINGVDDERPATFDTKHSGKRTACVKNSAGVSTMRCEKLLP